jgi:hypothetical protein
MLVPSVFLSLLASLFAIIFRRPALLVVGAILAAPAAFFIGSLAAFRYVGYSLPLFQVAAAILVKRHAVVATFLLGPLVALGVWLVVVLLRVLGNAAA